MSEDLLERRRRFAELYDANYELIRRYARRRAVQSADAEDVVAETFLIAWRRLDELRPGADNRAWLYGVARRVMANQRRGTRRRDALAERLQLENAHSLDDAKSDACTSQLETAFGRLAVGDQELLGLAYWEELDPGQIAVVLECSRNAARIRLHRARRRLEQALDQQHKSNAAGAGRLADCPNPVVSTKETR